MASLSHQDAVTLRPGRRVLAAALLAAGLLAGCGGDRSRVAGGSDTTGPAVTTPDPAAPAPPAAAAPAPAPAATPPETKQADTTKTAPVPTSAPTSTPTPTPTATAGAPLRDEYHQAPRDTVAQTVYNGWKQYNLNCARCHGEDALGTTIAPHLIVSLKPDGPINTKELFVQVVCAGRPEKGMPAWCALGLEMDKINDIYEYVKGRSDAKVSPGRPAVKQ
jgi:mono/diheme cytochrome c family protein